MFKGEDGNAPQVDKQLIEAAFHSSIAFLGSHGELQERGGQVEVVARGKSGIEISVASPFSQKDLETLSRVGERRKEDIVLGSPSRVRVSSEQTPTEDDELTLVKFDPGQLRYPPEDAWRMEGVVHKGVQFSGRGRGTPERLTERLNQLITGLR